MAGSLPYIEDLGDPGSWEDGLKYVRFAVSDFKPVDDVGRQLTEAGSMAPLPFHASEVRDA